MRSIFLFQDGEAYVASESVFHGRKAWVGSERTRMQVFFHSFFGWIDPLDFFADELFHAERTVRGGE